ncbi:MAG: hypothetical protein A3K12_15335 [Candidatus Rokubacteria bacterium RIFCSPLOWO2_12_FULL_71_19]|nr:MAG: hypothetical protein A3K12_15335 [Candidatus Rokubacteria bacterium RIFCSPLOWO2_12_FULL_71_19]
MEHVLRAVGEHGRVLVGHNVDFGRNVVAAEMYRLGYAKEAVENGFHVTRYLCLMTTAAALCRLPGRLGRPEYPTLAELHMRLFVGEPRGRQGALPDVEAGARCFFRFRASGVI